MQRPGAVHGWASVGRSPTRNRAGTGRRRGESAGAARGGRHRGLSARQVGSLHLRGLHTAHE